MEKYVSFPFRTLPGNHKILRGKGRWEDSPRRAVSRGWTWKRSQKDHLDLLCDQLELYEQYGWSGELCSSDCEGKSSTTEGGKNSLAHRTG